MCLAIPGKVEEIFVEHDLRMGRVNFGGVMKRVCVDYVPEVEVGDYVVVHVGFAISKLDAESAEQTLALFREMGALDEELGSEDEAFVSAAELPQASCPDGSCAPVAVKAGEDGRDSQNDKISQIDNGSSSTSSGL
jgi:hydrogenase expression/formation protein HypC